MDAFGNRGNQVLRRQDAEKSRRPVNDTSTNGKTAETRRRGNEKSGVPVIQDLAYRGIKESRQRGIEEISRWITREK